MAKQTVDTGILANDGQGDSLRDGAGKINTNFDEIYTTLGDGNNLLSADIDFGQNKILYKNVVATNAELQQINPTTYAGLIILVSNEGSLYYANNGTWHRILANDENNTIANYTDPLDTVAYSGDFNDLRNKPAVPSSLTDLNIQDGSAGQVLSTDGTGNFTFRDLDATSVNFDTIFNKPTTIQGYGITDAFSGDYNDLLNKPVLFDGEFSSLTNAPTIATDVSELTDTTNILFDGSYFNLTNKPAIPTDVNQLSDNDDLLASGFSGSYNDLTEKPTSFTNMASFSFNIGANISEYSVDGLLAGNSNTAVPTEAAVKTYVDAAVAGFSEIGNFSFTTDTSGASDVGVMTTSDAGGLRFDNATDITEKLTLSATGIGLEVDNNVSIAGNLTLSNNLINNLTLPSVTDTVAVVGDISTAVANYLPLTGGTITGNLDVDQDLNVTQDLTVTGTLNTNGLNLTGTGTYTFTSNTNVEIDAGNEIKLKNATNDILIVQNTGVAITGNLNVSADAGANNLTVTNDITADDIITNSIRMQGPAGTLITEFSTNTDFSGNRADVLPTESAVYGFVNNIKTLNGDVTGSVFGDDSTLLVDGVNNSISHTVLTDLPAEAHTQFGLSTAYSPSAAVNSGAYFQAEAVAGDNGQGGDIAVSLTVSGSNTKIKVELDAAIINTTDATTEYLVQLERTVNGANATDIKSFIFPPNQNFFGSQYFVFVDTHGASAGDVVEYKLKADMSSYANEQGRVQYGICGDTFYLRELA